MSKQVFTQPTSTAPLHLEYVLSEKISGLYQNGQAGFERHSSHNPLNTSQKRRMMWIAIASVLSAITLLALFCVWHLDPTWLAEWGQAPADLMKRAFGDGSTTGNNGNSTFIDRRYYLIVVFVGLFIVLILAVMLSAWCCRGAFHNPLCCPCYLCACCGGLACLECISCGLCVEGLENV